jgi:putative addiction module component (TIGR02574 family)
MVPQEILKLSTPEKLHLVQEIWEDIAAHPEGLALTREQELELDRRFEVHEGGPGAGISWEQARKKLRPEH